jgi:hypothetical protein
MAGASPKSPPDRCRKQDCWGPRGLISIFPNAGAILRFIHGYIPANTAKSKFALPANGLRRRNVFPTILQVHDTILQVWTERK